jgi:hypothetical protein
MAESRGDLLSLGVFLIIIVAIIVLFVAGIIDWTLIVPALLVLSGCLLMATAAYRPSTKLKYAPSAFYSLTSGLFLIALGGAWYLFRVNWLYSLALILLVLGAVAIAAALRRK